jgi:signal transduction histidine kinase
MSLRTYRMRLILTGCLSLFLLISSFAQVAPASFYIRHFTDEDGLPQNSVKCLAPDEHGFLWMATENGLVRFDGNQFLVFNSSNLPIQNSRLQYIYPAAAGKGGLLARTAKKELLVIRNGKAALPATPCREFDYIFYINDPTLFPLTDLPDGYLEDARADHFLVPAAPDAYFRIRRDTIRFIKGGKEQYQLHYDGLGPGNLFAYNDQLYCLDKKRQFVLLRQDGAHILKLEGDLLQHRKTAAGPQQEEVLYWNFAARQLFVYKDQSCYRIELRHDTIIRSKLALKDFDFRRNAIATIYQDTVNQRIFLGSRTKGLFICNWRQFRSLKAGWESDEVYYAQALFGKDKIVTPGGAVFNRNGKLDRLPMLQKTGTTDKYSMTRDINGNYWYKSFTRLFKFNQDGSAILWEQALDAEINQLYADTTGRLWIATKTKGLYYLETTAATPRIQIFSARLNDVSYMLLDDHNVLWAGTGNGLYRIDPSSRRIDTVPGFNNRYVRSLYRTGKDEIWITTYNHGIFLWKDGHFTSLPQDDKKYLATAHCIVKDDRGFLWITTNKGLFQLSYQDALNYAKGEKPELFYLYYGKDKGFNTNEFNGGCQPCAVKLENGDISLPSLDGLVYFSPAAVRPELPDKQIFIDEAELDAKKITVDSAISLPHNFHHFRLYISTPYFGDRNNLQLYYSFEEEDGDKGIWLKVSDSRIIEFSSMHSGSYRLRIRKVNGFGSNRIMERQFTIHVKQGFYETIWFRLIVLTLITLIAFACSSFWVRRVNRKNRQLETHVMERTRELKETLDNLQFSEQQLRRQGFIQQRLTAAISHDLKTPLKYVMQVIRKEHNDKAEISNDERNIVYESLYNMFHLVENLISYMKSQFASDDSSLEIADLYQVLEEKANIFRTVSVAKQVVIINDTPPGTMVLVNRQLLAIVIHNLLDNAVKYTRNGHVRLLGLSDEEKIRIRLEDTGIGMPLLVTAWINQYGNGSPVTQGKPLGYDGIGLLMVMELLQLINGNIAVSPNDGGGTVIEITLDVIR